MLKKTLSILLTVLLVLTVLPLAAVPAFADPDPEPDPGPDYTWAYDDDTKTLSFTGGSALPDFPPESNGGFVLPETPWSAYMDEAEHVVIGEGITRVGSMSFTTFTKLQDVILPSTLTSIGMGAFAYCFDLESVNLPAGLTSIEENAFVFNKLSNVVIPAGITELKGMFSYNTAPLSITLPEGLTTIENCFDYTVIPNLTIPASVTSFTGYVSNDYSTDPAIMNVKNLVNNSADVAVSDYLVSIREDMVDTYFFMMLAEYRVELVYLRTGNEPTPEDMEEFYLYYYNTLLGTEFTSFAELEELFSGNEIPQELLDRMDEIEDATTTVRAPLSDISIYCLADSAEHDALRANGFPHYIIDNDNALCEEPVIMHCGDDLLWEVDADTRTLTVTGHGAMYDNYRGWLFYRDSVDHILFVQDGGAITRIGEGAFENFGTLETVTLPAGVTSFGTYWLNDSTVGTLILPAGFTYWEDSPYSSPFESYADGIGAYAVTAGNPVYFTENGSLYGTKYGKTYLLRYAGTGAAAQISADTDVIREYAFYGNKTITSVTIPANVSLIGFNAFYNCISLTSVTLEPSAHTLSLSLSAFSYCDRLAAFTVDETDPRFTAVDGVLYNKAITKLVAVPIALSEVTVPATVTGVYNPNANNAYCGRGAGLTKLTVLNPSFDFGYNYNGTTSAFCIRSMNDPAGIEICGAGASTAETFALKYGYTFTATDGNVIESVVFDLSGVPQTALVGSDLSFSNWNITGTATYTDGTTKQLSYHNNDFVIMYRSPNSTSWMRNNWVRLDQGLGDYEFKICFGEFTQTFTITAVVPDFHYEFDTADAITEVKQYAKSDNYSRYGYGEGEDSHVLGVRLYKVYDDPETPRELVYIGYCNVNFNEGDSTWGWSDLMTREIGETFTVHFSYAANNLQAETDLQVTVVPGDFTISFDTTGVPATVPQFGTFTVDNWGAAATLTTVSGNTYDISQFLHFHATGEADPNNSTYDSMGTSLTGEQRINAYVYTGGLTVTDDVLGEISCSVLKYFDPFYVTVTPGEYDHIRIEVPEVIEVEKECNVNLLNYVNAYIVYADNTEEPVPDKSAFRFDGTSSTGGHYSGTSCYLYNYGDVIDYTVTFGDLSAFMRVIAVQTIFYEVTYTTTTFDAWPSRSLYVADFGLQVLRTENGETADITSSVWFGSGANTYNGPGSYTAQITYYEPELDSYRTVGEIAYTVVTGTTFEVRGLPSTITVDRYGTYDLSGVEIVMIRDGAETALDEVHLYMTDNASYWYSMLNTNVDPGVYELRIYGYAPYNNSTWYVGDDMLQGGIVPVVVEDAVLILKGANTTVNQNETYELGGAVYTRNLATGEETLTTHTAQVEYGNLWYLPTDVPGVIEAQPYVSFYYGTSYLLDPLPVTVKCAAHTLSPVAAASATCYEDGNTAYWECTVCGTLFADEAGTNEIDISATVLPAGHAMQQVSPVTETCTAPGNIACWYCPQCETYFADEEGLTALDYETDVLIPAPGHDMVPHEGAGATCYEDGNLPYNECLRCRKLFADAEGAEEITDPAAIVLPAHHTLTRVPAAPATCTAPGNSEYFTCSACGNWFSDAAGTVRIEDKTTVVIPAKTHNWGAWTKVDDSTHKRVCANDPAHVETGNHTWDGGRITTAPTCVQNGVRTFTCTVCGATRTEGVSKVGHKDDNGDGWCDFGCGTAMGGTPTEPSNPGGSSADECPLCHETHTGFLGKIVGFFHRIIYFFKNLFSR